VLFSLSFFGLPEWIEKNKLNDRLKPVVISDKQGKNSVVEKTLPEATLVISQPLWPCYLDQTRIDKAKNLKLAVTAGVGSDHVNLEAACKRSKFGRRAASEEETRVFV
jgi:formate dehydrogenase